MLRLYYPPMIHGNWPVTSLVTCACLLMICCGAFAADPISTRVMSFNVRNSHEDDGADDWSHRMPLFFETIDADHPDLIGFQEVLADQHDAIAAHLSDFELSGVARDDGKRVGEWSLLAYRKARFERLAEGNFWLSEHPDQPGSKSWDAACTRICSWVRLRDKSTAREFLFANTHWDHVGVIARMKAADVIKERLPALSNGNPVILTGDLNSTEDDGWVKSLLHATQAGQVQLFDSYRETHPKQADDERTFHAFKGNTQGSRIDFILHSPELTAIESGIDRHHSPSGHYPSDHFPVTAVLGWK